MRRKETADRAFLEFIKAQAPTARRPARAPATAEAWDKRLDAVRKGLARSFGRFPGSDCELEPDVLGTIDRDGYVIERLTFQSRPGVRVTANLYRPEPVRGKCAAVLSVHGHWPWARIDPAVQERCIALAKLGYVCLCVDAFGAGERAVVPARGTYHGALLGASLWPAGVPLLGLQVYDNRRAVDYLISRPEVDPDRLAITGASGGGNQTMYAGATDPRLKVVVPVCGVGRLEAYLGTGCCVCELLVGGLTYATTGDLLALVAPRALLVINATRDAPQFSVVEAARSVVFARERFRSLDAEPRLKHLAVEAEHGYDRTMREALYGWLGRWLRDEGDGGPIAEPTHATEDPERLRCYPDAASRPKSVVTIPEFASREGNARLAELPPVADHPERWEADSIRMRTALVADVFGGFPARVGLELVHREESAGVALEMTSEPGLRLRGRFLTATAAPMKGTALLLRNDGMAPPDDPAVRALRRSGRHVLTVDLRASGARAPQAPAVQGVADHHPAEWALWIGRPLLGQWTWDALRWLDALDLLDKDDAGEDIAYAPYEVVGLGPFGLVAMLAGGLDPGRVRAVAASRPPMSFVGEGPWAGWPMGLIAPTVLDVGDVGHLAALVAPRRLAVGGGFGTDGADAPRDRLADAFAPTRAIYATLKARDRLVVLPDAALPPLIEALDG
ncbi:MAG TPA: acetylxylan esterase [Isosphaeraceae bacterium]|jgi:dienelactone hydrolase|nr:acetylxylan esterase [Isosphaeraceae bacterium]